MASLEVVRRMSLESNSSKKANEVGEIGVGKNGSMNYKDNCYLLSYLI